MANGAKFDAYQMVTDRIIAMLEQGIIPWQRPWAMANTTAWSGDDGHTYSLLNQFLLADPRKKYSGMDDLMADVAGEWVTLKQANERGGRVKKGEHGRQIVFYTVCESDDTDKDGNPIKKQFPFLKVSTVFKLSQCEGIEQKYHKDANTLYDFAADQTAESVASGYTAREGVQVHQVHGNRAFYSPATDSVTIPLPEQFKDSAEYYSTLFHELTHSTGHEKRLNRINKNAAFGSDDYSAEELVAEIGSCSIMATLGIESAGSFRNSAAYVQGWLKALHGDKRLIVTAARKAEKAIQLIFGTK